MIDRVGQQLGNYRLIRLLGKGSFGEVYLATHVYLQKPAAIKVLRDQLAETRQRHANGSCLPLPLVISYVKQIASALDYAHARKVIHRDIKPENMLLGANSDVLLSDFGIALVSHSSRYQSTQEVVGTVSYMAPEQLESLLPPAGREMYCTITAPERLHTGMLNPGILTRSDGRVIASTSLLAATPMSSRSGGRRPKSGNLPPGSTLKKKSRSRKVGNCGTVVI